LDLPTTVSHTSVTQLIEEAEESLLHNITQLLTIFFILFHRNRTNMLQFETRPRFHNYQPLSIHPWQ